MRIGVFIPDCSWGSLDHTSMSRGLGGRETALVSLCMEWAKLGHKVSAFVPRDDVLELPVTGEGKRRGKITWIPAQRVLQVAPFLGLDFFVSWEDVSLFAAFKDADVGRRVLHLQVAHVEAPVEISSVCDDVAVLSRWAGDFLVTQHPDVADKITVLPNGVDLSRFPEQEVHRWWNMKEEEHPLRFVYSSSPDRGLHHLLLMWSGIQAAVKNTYGRPSELLICYGLENFVAASRWSHREDALRALTIEEYLDQEGVVYHGRIGQDKLAEVLMSADLMTYCFDPISPTETGCISIAESLAAGTPVVTTDGDCIGESYSEVTTQIPLPLVYDDYIDAIVETLNYEDYAAQAEAGREWVEERRTWDKIARDWIEEFCGAPV